MVQVLLSSLLGAVRSLRSVVAAIGFTVLISGIWMPLVFEANVPRPLEEGVVVETSPRSSRVVLLDSGVYLAADSIPGAPGDRVQVYDSPWNDPSGSSSTFIAWLATSMVGFMGMLVTFLIFGGIGKLFLAPLERVLLNAVREDRHVR